MSEVTLHLGDCRDVLPTLPDNSVDSIVTDPPYELGFMNKRWDSTGIAYDVNVWRECLRVLKPGGHLLAFGGSRTYHRLACAVEDAGFEIRDQIMWICGSGFPKSLDVSKAIDKAAGAKREVVGFRPDPDGRDRRQEISGAQARENDVLGTDNRPRSANGVITAPATPDAETWQGWGTALKPAHEPIVLARKPLIGTVAANVLRWGCGALNIDQCRVLAGDESSLYRKPTINNCDRESGRFQKNTSAIVGSMNDAYTLGRFPANVMHDGSDEVVGLFPETKGGTWNRTRGARHFNNNGEPTDYETQGTDSSTGSAARFFYCSKASKRDRDEGLEGMEEVACGQMYDDAYQWRDDVPNGCSTKKPVRRNFHPCVKPTALMRYLCRLVTPPGGVVLDPFTGSGSTGKAAVLEGFGFVGIEKEAEYLAIAERRIEHAREQTLQPALL